MKGDYEVIEKVIRYIEERHRCTPSEEALAAHLGIIPSQLQRLFLRFSGIEPAEFIQFLSAEYTMKLLEESSASSRGKYGDPSIPGKAGEHAPWVVSAVTVEPGAIGRGVDLVYGFHESPFGECILSLSQRGVCGLQFTSQKGKDNALRELKSSWSGARFKENMKVTARFMERIFSLPGKSDRVTLFLKGTQFQIRVWKALLRIPFGGAISYSGLAKGMGMEGADRAVGNAVGANPLAYIIPCHRVIRKNGSFGHYRSGSLRKMAMIGWEAARRKLSHNPEIYC